MQKLNTRKTSKKATKQKAHKVESLSKSSRTETQLQTKIRKFTKKLQEVSTLGLNHVNFPELCTNSVAASFRGSTGRAEMRHSRLQRFFRDHDISLLLSLGNRPAVGHDEKV